MKKIITGSLICSMVVTVGCQSSEKMSEVSSPSVETSSMAHRAQESDAQASVSHSQSKPAGPQVFARKDGAVMYRHHGRIYVVTEAMSEKFMKHGHLPYTKTMIGAGPQRETIVYEIDKKNPAVVEKLKSAYEATPILLKQMGSNFYVFSKSGRIVVVGSETMAEKFQKHGHIPYAKTLIGAGARGETIIYEIDKKDPMLTERLMKTYKAMM